MSNPTFKPRLHIRLGIRLGLPFLLITIVMAGVAGYMVSSSYQLQIQFAQERQRQASAQASFKVASYVSQFRAQLDDAARGLMYTGASPARQRDWLERMQLAHREFYDLAATDTSGQETARTILLVPEYLTILQSRADTPAVHAALSGQFYQGRVYLSEQQPSPFVQVAAPVYDAVGKITGTLIAEVDLSQLWNVVNGAEAGQDGYVYVVDEEGRLIAYGESQMVQGPAMSLPRVEPAPAVSRYLAQRAESTEIAVYPSGLQCILHRQCEAVLAYFRPIEGTGWGVIVEQPASSAYAQANKLLALAVGLVVMALILMVALVVYIRRGVLRPINLLGEGATALAGGNLTQRIAVHTGDEIEALATKFNLMAESMQHSQSQLEEYGRTLEQRVVERTAELAQRAMHLELSSQVSQQIISILDLDELLDEVVHLIQSRFGYYFVGVWLLTDKQDRVALRAGTGRAGEDLPEQGFRISMEAASIIVWVCKSGQGRSVDDVSQASDYLAIDVWPDVRSELALPLRMGPVVIGALDILSDQLAAFTPDDQLVLQTLADQIAIAVRNAQFYKAEQTRRWFAESLERAGRELASYLDLREVPGRIMEQLASVLPYERGAVMLEYGGELQISAHHGFPDDEDDGRVKELSVPIHEDDVFRQVATTCRPVILDDVTKVSGWQQIDWLPLNQSWMGVPLISKGQVIGMISLTRREAEAFSSEDATLVSAFAGQAAIALENASLYDEIARFNEQLEQMVLQRTEELNKAYQTLEKLDQTKSDFISVAAHELRTPLTVMQGYTAMMRSDVTIQKNPYLLDAMNGLLNGAERLYEIISSMLDVARIDSQVLDLRPEPTWIAPLVQHVRKDFAAALEERRLTLDMKNLADLPHINADPKLLTKVFYNVVMNAIKFTPDGGAITISGQHIHDTRLGEFVEILVRDTGIGIDPEHHDLIFEKFYQTGRVALHSSGRTKFKGGGPGLGLAIARGIVQAHNGRIWVESEGCNEETCPGSCFHILLPVSSPEAHEQFSL